MKMRRLQILQPSHFCYSQAFFGKLFTEFIFEYYKLITNIAVLITAMAKDSANTQMLTLARESRGISQKEAAEQLEVSPSTISMAESNLMPVGNELLSKLSELYKYPSSFFYQQGEVFPSLLNYRKRLKVPQKLMIPIEANVNIYKLNIQELMNKIKLDKPDFPALDVDKLGSPMEAAKQLRKLWSVPKGAISNLTELIESKGIIIVSFDFGTERVDSRGIMTDEGFPIIYINKTLLGDRQRFTLAYELGHLVMHIHKLPSADREISKEANKFAAEFLMPDKDIKKDLEDLTLPKLAELKGKWKVSMQSLVYRGNDLEVVTDNQKRYLIGQFNTNNIRRREPPELDIPKEKPTLLTQLISKYRSRQKMSVADLASLLHLYEEDFIKRYTF
jgi:Zn-dependent peptidase ImmA (M78 family)/DNA-binding XRE family transcriptional regulator